MTFIDQEHSVADPAADADPSPPGGNEPLGCRILDEAASNLGMTTIGALAWMLDLREPE